MANKIIKKCERCHCEMNNPDDDDTDEVILVDGGAGKGEKTGMCRYCWREKENYMFR